MTTRVYVPATVRRLGGMVESGVIAAAPFLAHTVTAAVRDALPGGGEEEWEHAAATAAAQASVAALDADEPARRVVLAVDVPAVSGFAGQSAGDLAGAGDVTLVKVAETAPLRWLAAVLADSAEAEPDVAAARDAAAHGAADAERLLDRCLDHDLGWWAAQEVGVLLEDAHRR